MLTRCLSPHHPIVGKWLSHYSVIFGVLMPRISIRYIVFSIVYISVSFVFPIYYMRPEQRPRTAMPFVTAMIWRECTNHTEDIYFCMAPLVSEENWTLWIYHLFLSHMAKESQFLSRLQIFVSVQTRMITMSHINYPQAWMSSCEGSEHDDELFRLWWNIIYNYVGGIE